MTVLCRFETGKTLTHDDFFPESKYHILYVNGLFETKRGTTYHFYYYGKNEIGEPIIHALKYMRKGQNWGWYRCTPPKELVNAYNWA